MGANILTRLRGGPLECLGPPLRRRKHAKPPTRSVGPPLRRREHARPPIRSVGQPLRRCKHVRRALQALGCHAGTCEGKYEEPVDLKVDGYSRRIPSEELPGTVAWIGSPAPHPLSI
jgi:hypothetical protein